MSVLFTVSAACVATALVVPFVFRLFAPARPISR
jgi:hypothetical protein